MKTTYILLLVFAIGFQSCSDFVDVERPGSQLTGITVFADRTSANAAMTEVYAKLRDGGILSGSIDGASYRLGLYADELDYYGLTATTDESFYLNSLMASNGFISQSWNSCYSQVYGANAILEGVEGSTTLSVGDKNQFRGEALFVRALVHFYLMNIYGDIPYIVTTNYEVNRVSPRLASDIINERLISDLTESASLLSESYISGEKVRPNQSTVYALLARVYLYNKMWAEAANAASAVLNNPEYVLEEDLSKTFLKECTSTIWQFAPHYSGGNTDEGDTFIFNAGPPTRVALSSNLMASFSPEDKRKMNWTNKITQGAAIWYHAYKYKQNYEASESSEYSIIFRLAEQYLIRSEARAQQGELIGAREDLNKVRNTAGLNNVSAVTASEIIDAIIEERRLEFFTEYGHRFFDLKRTDQLNNVLGASKIGWNDYDALWPLPLIEIMANPNLSPQNPGY